MKYFHIHRKCKLIFFSLHQLLKASQPMRELSIIAYFFIFLQGSIIPVPFVLLLVAGLRSMEPLTGVFIIMADITLLTLLFIAVFKRSKTRLFIESVAFIFLLLPLLRMIFFFSFSMFNNVWFLFSFGCFIILYPWSVVRSYRKYKNSISETDIPEGSETDQ